MAPRAAAPCLSLLAWPASQIPALPPRFAQYGTGPLGKQGWDNSMGIPTFALSQSHWHLWLCEGRADLWRTAANAWCSEQDSNREDSEALC